jgi:hypothetical protein
LLENSDDAHPLVAGFFNGAEGDISPRRVTQDRSDLVRIGGLFAAAGWHCRTASMDGGFHRDEVSTVI